MIANATFQNMPEDFWSQVRVVSQHLKYTEKNSKALRHYSDADIVQMSIKYGVTIPEDRVRPVLDYLNLRADLLNQQVQRDLMYRHEAQEVYEALEAQLNPTIRRPLNKQSGEKRNPAYMTGIVNMLTADALGLGFDSDPQRLVTFSRSGVPVYTLSRRMDGAYPCTENPKAVWEIKEYYYTNTFGSKVSDGVYETQLDGWEIRHYHVKQEMRLLHYLIVDAKLCWWDLGGRSYLCRIVDMLHMGLVDEVIFGREVVRRWPDIVRSWV